ncbi:hypothetical protein E8E11_009040 [Didymella keratinophila]|nr:hypothetical protein E8E11_009040 [Didymella keratinophila]
MTSRFVDPYQPPKPIPQAEYEVSHHQYCGQDRVLLTSVSTFPILHDAQDSAQDLLQTTLNQYMSRGWIGFYCNDIDLEHRGLIAGYLSEQEHVYLSEIQTHAREKADQTVQPHADGVEAWVLATEHQPQEYSSYSEHTREMESFLRTRPQYPDRTDFFVPRPTAQYDETMGFSALQNHGANAYQALDADLTQQQSSPRRHANALGGVDIGSPYLGRRHSSIELKLGSKPFQYTIEEY